MFKPILIGEFLHRKKEPVTITPDKFYSLVTVKLHHKGVVLREKKKGSLLGSTMHKISKGQFILSGIDARNGAFGVVPDELDGAIITNDFWCFDVDETKVKRDFFFWLTNTSAFLDACQKSSKGETQRIRLQKDLFYNIEFHFPPVEKQEIFLRSLQTTNNTLESLNNELNAQSETLMQLRQSILQEAIEGKLTAEWRKKNPVRKGNPDYDASALLEKIKKEKQKMIEAGKIRKEKPLAPIKEEEKPFELPEGWVWCRLGEIAETLSTGPFGSMLHKSDYVKIGIPVINPTTIMNRQIIPDPRMQISKNTRTRLNRYVLRQGDVVIARRGNLEKCAVVSDEQEGWLCGTRSFFLRLLRINLDFFLLVYSSIKSQNYLLQDSVGQTMDNLNQKLLIKIPIGLPPLAEQSSIVSRVNHLLALVSDLEKQVAERKNQSEELMQSVLREAFEGK